MSVPPHSLPGELLKPGKNCWKVFYNQQASVLMDAEAYFESLYESLLQAEKQILIVGWDLDTRIQLLNNQDKSEGLLEFLRRLIWKNKKLKIFILCWNYAPIYVLDRELFVSLKLAWSGIEGLHCHFDNEHPFTACHHQKIVVIDDAIAFGGGIDLAKNRWDTPLHKAHEVGRKNSAGEVYQPFHDVQMVVSGEAAAALGRLCRKRWNRATRISIAAPRVASRKAFDFAFRQVTLAIARTEPPYKGQDAVREIETLYCEQISLAKSYLYFENQYVTSQKIGQALIESLHKPEGPLIILVLSKKAEGLLEEANLWSYQKKLLSTVKANDYFDRFKVFYPDDPELPAGQQIKVHSKVLICDDRWLRVGSANLNNRSMGLDTECDLIIESHNNRENCIKIKIYVLQSLGHFLKINQKQRSRGERITAEMAGFLSGFSGVFLKPFQQDLPPTYHHNSYLESQEKKTRENFLINFDLRGFLEEHKNNPYLCPMDFEPFDRERNNIFGVGLPIGDLYQPLSYGLFSNIYKKYKKLFLVVIVSALGSLSIYFYKSFMH